MPCENSTDLVVVLAETLGRISGCVEMLNDPGVWQMTPERFADRVRQIMLEHGENMARRKAAAAGDR